MPSTAVIDGITENLLHVWLGSARSLIYTTWSETASYFNLCFLPAFSIKWHHVNPPAGGKFEPYWISTPLTHGPNLKLSMT